MSELWSIIAASEPDHSRPLASMRFAVPPQQQRCWPKRPTSKNAGARAITSTNACARCSFFTRFIVFICREGRRHAAGHSFHSAATTICFPGATKRRLAFFLAASSSGGLSDGLSSALAAAYRGLSFQTLAYQVRRSVRSVRGNQWMFRTGHPADYPLRIRPELLAQGAGGSFPILHEATPVRMDLSHSGWSDIFFLGMDLPEWARVLNISIDLALRGSSARAPKPPVEAYFRIIDSADDPSGQHRSRCECRDPDDRRSCSISAAIIWACSRPRSSLRDWFRRGWRALASRLRTC